MYGWKIIIANVGVKVQMHPTYSRQTDLYIALRALGIFIESSSGADLGEVVGPLFPVVCVRSHNFISSFQQTKNISNDLLEQN